MSKLLQNQDAPEDILLEDDAESALHEGFLQLETPVPASSIELTIKQELTSGTDFDPLYRQVGRRVLWTGVPAIAAFITAMGVLALFSVPRVSLTRWQENNGLAYPKQDAASLQQVYAASAPLPEPKESSTGFRTELRGKNPPDWFKKPPEIAKPKTGRIMPANTSGNKAVSR